MGVLLEASCGWTRERISRNRMDECEGQSQNDEQVLQKTTGPPKLNTKMGERRALQQRERRAYLSSPYPCTRLAQCCEHQRFRVHDAARPFRHLDPGRFVDQDHIHLLGFSLFALCHLPRLRAYV